MDFFKAISGERDHLGTDSILSKINIESHILGEKYGPVLVSLGKWSMWHYSLDVEKVWYEYTKNPSMVTFYNAWRALRKSEIELSDEETEISLRTFFLISTIGGSLIVSIFHTIKKVYQARSKTKDKKERKETKTPEPKMLPLVVITFLCRMVISCFDLYVKYFLGTLLIVATLKLLVLQEGLIELSGYIIVSTFITEHIVVLLASFPTSFLLFCLNEEKEEVVANETPALIKGAS